MNRILTLLVVFMISSPVLSQPPTWYENMKRQDGELIGFGEGKTLKEAEVTAKARIATQIKATVKSNFILKTKMKDDEVSQEARDLIESTTEVILTDVTVKKKEKIDKVWYVALSYLNLPFEKKFAMKLGAFKCKDVKQNRYLNKTPLVKLISKELGCEIDVKLVRKSGLWHMAYQNVMQPLTSFDFEKLYTGYHGKDVEITSSNTLFTEGNTFAFKIKSKRNGYLSLFNVYEDGQVFTLLRNKSVTANKRITFPPTSSDQELVAGLLRPKMATFELYIAVFSERKLELSRFQQAGTELVQGEFHYKFAELMDILDKHDFSASMIRIKPWE